MPFSVSTQPEPITTTIPKHQNRTKSHDNYKDILKPIFLLNFLGKQTES